MASGPMSDHTPTHRTLPLIEIVLLALIALALGGEVLLVEVLR